MMNKKMIAILMAAITVTGLSAYLCYDRYDNEISCTGRVVEGTVDTTGEVVHGAMPWNWGEGGKERREQRYDEREARREEEAARRSERRAARENNR